MADRNELREALLQTPVWDTHTHLIGGELPAQSFWDIAHYFWFLRELQAAGYPQQPEALGEEARIAAFLKAFRATRNTSMNWVVRQILGNLYGQEISDAASVRLADEAVRASAAQPDWPRRVCQQLNIKRIVTNRPDHAPFPELPAASYVLPRLETQLGEWIRTIQSADNQRLAAKRIVSAMDGLFDGFVEAGYQGVMTSEGPFGQLAKPTHLAPEMLDTSGNGHEDIALFVLHALCRAAEARGMFLQLFLGVQGSWARPNGAIPMNDTRRIVNLHGLFHSYACPFELVLGAELNTLDAVQAARIFPHVHLGGLWWYNFRASTYRATMQMRLEALPPSKSALIASDARCIEWCYGKILLVKRWMADFLHQQVELGWLSEKDAPWVAQEWLHDAAARLYKH